MKKYKLIKYDAESDRFQAKDDSGENIYLDLTTDSSFPEITNSDAYKNCGSKDEFTALMKSFEGKTIECEGIHPYIPVYFVGGGRFVS